MLVDQCTDRPERIRSGFSLLELLVVVAILSILAAIAVPNYLQAQTRAKVARVKTDMKTLEVAIQLYYVDWKAYPVACRLNKAAVDTGGFGLWYANFLYYDDRTESMFDGCMAPNNLTTPVAYLSAPPPPDPFNGRKNCSYFFYNFKGATRKNAGKMRSPVLMHFNGSGGPVFRAHWALLSPGPDGTVRVANPDNPSRPWDAYEILGGSEQQWQAIQEGRYSIYDPSNGTVSGGDIWRTNQGSPQ